VQSIAAILPDRRLMMLAAVPLWKVSLAPPRRRTKPGPQGPGFFCCLLLICTYVARLRHASIRNNNRPIRNLATVCLSSVLFVTEQ
jgi:hypothetical protein